MADFGVPPAGLPRLAALPQDSFQVQQSGVRRQGLVRLPQAVALSLDLLQALGADTLLRDLFQAPVSERQGLVRLPQAAALSQGLFQALQSRVLPPGVFLLKGHSYSLFQSLPAQFR